MYPSDFFYRFKKVEGVTHSEFQNKFQESGGWISARLSGTEPLLRIASEMPSKKEASELCDIYQEFLEICS
nr:hypothetical protein [Tepidanaerobacter syntrophicus]